MSGRGLRFAAVPVGEAAVAFTGQVDRCLQALVPLQALEVVEVGDALVVGPSTASAARNHLS